MGSGSSALLPATGFGLVTLIFAVTQPLVLAGLPFVLLIVAYGPQSGKSAAAAVVVITLALVGNRSGVWWFERSWPLLVGGSFVWTVGWRPRWSFTAQALAALGLATAAVTIFMAARPGAWLDLDASMAARATRATAAASGLLGDRADDAVRAVMDTVAALQVAVFPAMLGLSTISALGLAVIVRGWLGGEPGRAIEPLRNFNFNDHLVWIWLIGLALIVAPIGEIAARVGSNAVLFMGLLYVVRGAAVLLSLVGGISVIMGLVGGLVALLIYPLLALLLLVALVVGLGDTWLNIRGRLKSQESDL